MAARMPAPRLGDTREPSGGGYANGDRPVLHPVVESSREGYCQRRPALVRFRLYSHTTRAQLRLGARIVSRQAVCREGGHFLTDRNQRL